MSNELPGINWEDTEKPQSRDYVGLVTMSEVREVSPERYLEWSTQPHQGVTPRELHIEVQPLSVSLLRHNFDKEEVNYFEYHIAITAPDGSTKRANSAIGTFRESARKLGFPDPTTIAGRVFDISETTRSYGKFEGRVTLLTAFRRDGYTHEGELKMWDFRKKDDSQGVPEMTPETVSGGGEQLTQETAEALAAALDGASGDDAAAINNAGRQVSQTSVVRTLQYNGELIPLLEQMGAIAIVDGVIHPQPQPATA